MDKNLLDDEGSYIVILPVTTMQEGREDERGEGAESFWVIESVVDTFSSPPLRHARHSCTK